MKPLLATAVCAAIATAALAQISKQENTPNETERVFQELPQNPVSSLGALAQKLDSTTYGLVGTATLLLAIGARRLDSQGG